MYDVAVARRGGLVIVALSLAATADLAFAEQPAPNGTPVVGTPVVGRPVEPAPTEAPSEPVPPPETPPPEPEHGSHGPSVIARIKHKLRPQRYQLGVARVSGDDVGWGAALGVSRITLGQKGLTWSYRTLVAATTSWARGEGDVTLGVGYLLGSVHGIAGVSGATGSGGPADPGSAHAGVGADLLLPVPSEETLLEGSAAVTWDLGGVSGARGQFDLRLLRVLDHDAVVSFGVGWRALDDGNLMTFLLGLVFVPDL